MKKIYNFKRLAERVSNRAFQMSLFFLLVIGAPLHYYSQQSYTFTTCGATGAAGPTQAQASSTYSLGNSLNGSVTIIGSGIQQFTVPSTGFWLIETRGARGYSPVGAGGRGAIMRGEFNLTAGDVLRIVVGQEGQINPASGTLQFGGGGGSFVARLNNTPLCIAGGGGGSHANSYAASTADGTVSLTGNDGVGSAAGLGGTAGQGGQANSSANGGAGFLGDGGGTSAAALSFTNGAIGGNIGAIAVANGGIGGFGGGGGTTSWNNNRGGGGGGYSGGGGAQLGQPTCWGGGGGSFNSGTNQLNLSGANTASNGLVIITELCNVRIINSSSGTVSPVALCSGQSLTLTTNAISNYSWSTGATTNSIVVAPNTNTLYTLSATSSLNCVSSASLNVTVNAGVPVLSIANPSSNICLGRTVSLTATGAITYTWANAGVVNGQTFTPTGTSVYTVTGQNGCGTSIATTSITVSPLPVSTSATPTLICEGYPATLTAVSTVTNYTWTPGSQTGSAVTVAPIVPTIYTVTASDGICSGTQTVLVNTKTTPTIVTSQSLVTICLGQSLTLSASGAGTGGTYSWTPGGTGSSIVLAPSTSTAVVVAGTNSLNCTATAQQIIIVAQPPALSVTANKTAVCTGDAVILTANGAPIYQWANGPATANFTVNPAVTTVYTVTGSQTTNTCTIDATITINAIVPNVTITNSVVVCEGGSVNIVATGASLYKWNGGLNSTNGNYQTTPAVSSIFTLVATTSSFNVNCLTTHFASVTVNPNPTITVTPGKQTICRGETHTLTATGATNYTWTTATGNGSVVTVKPTTTTNYTVTGTNDFGCESSIIYNAKVSACNSITEASANNALSVYPNPNNGVFNISAEKDITVHVINGLGQVVRELNLNATNNHVIEVKDLDNGIYFVVGESAEGKINQKIIINK